MRILEKIFKKRVKGLLVLSTRSKNISNPTFKQVVEHIKELFDKDEFIELAYREEDSKLAHLKASPADEGKGYNLEYLSKEKDEYFLKGSDVEQTMCFFRDFLEGHRIVDFDLTNNNWTKNIVREM
ncbi:MAG: hypothetical protein Q4E50_06250 [Tissierellia bacterium]|nr:hypothetical protein [Tissierellia bacterium]